MCYRYMLLHYVLHEYTICCNSDDTLCMQYNQISMKTDLLLYQHFMVVYVCVFYTKSFLSLPNAMLTFHTSGDLFNCLIIFIIFLRHCDLRCQIKSLNFGWCMADYLLPLGQSSRESLGGTTAAENEKGGAMKSLHNLNCFFFLPVPSPVQLDPSLIHLSLLDPMVHFESVLISLMISGLAVSLKHAPAPQCCFSFLFQCRSCQIQRVCLHMLHITMTEYDLLPLKYGNVY